ncbi:uncharacterized protein LOC143851069 [Tasmannia lanceolata]|uniref:uncharacterized protein LOC143851069 n=1 Tax=Tasmannia lanceolata TaxID=3420 RepID=UPI00406376F1
MLDGLLGKGFSSKCKSLIKLIRSRIDMIKRKRNAMLKYLKKDISDLLKNGLDKNAYSRAEGLLIEMNLSSCYDLIEQFCGCILEQLSSMQKQRDCPPESRVAASSLMFAAARFADLPELRDLRRIFTERYGNALESSVNVEFLEKIASKPPSMDQKLQLMRDISQEFSINWDSRAFKERVSNPSASVLGRTTKSGTPQNGKDDAVISRQEISSHGRVEVTPSPEYKARQEIKTEIKGTYAIPSSKKDPPQSELNTSGYKEATENVKLHSTSKMAPPPYVKPKDRRYGANSEAPHTGSNHNGPTDPPIESNASAIGHVKPERTQAKSNGCADEKDHHLDNAVHDEKSKPRSVRRKHLKPPVHENGSTEDNVQASRHLSDGRSQGQRRSIPTHGDEIEIDEEEKFMDRLLIHYSKKQTFDNSKIALGLKALIGSNADADESPNSRNKDKPGLKRESGFAPSRAMSLPPEPTTTEEVHRGPVRATSFQPDVCGGHVHPKLPDYDDLAARFAALKGRGV